MKETAVLVVISALIAVSTGSSPEFEKSFENRTVVEGERAEILCYATGERPITYTWYNQNEDRIPEGPGRDIYVSDSVNGSTLIVEAMRFDHEGMYTCSAKNSHGLLTKLFYLGVSPRTGNRPPEFEKPFENVTVTEGERLEVYCHATGESPMSYKWVNQTGDTIPEDTRRDIYASKIENGSRLTMKQVRLHDNGYYLCIASNIHGESFKGFTFFVSPRTGNDTDDSTFDVEVLNVSSNSVRFRIAIRNGKKAFGNFLQVKYRESENGTEYIKNQFIDLNDIYDIKDLIPGGIYSFQFRMSNNNGAWSETIRVTLLPDVPEIICRRPEKGSIEFEWFIQGDDRNRGSIDGFEITYYVVSKEYNNYWTPSDCRTTIQLPSCRRSQYTISGLEERMYYQIELRAHTAGGYGEPARHKIYLPGNESYSNFL